MDVTRERLEGRLRDLEVPRARAREAVHEHERLRDEAEAELNAILGRMGECRFLLEVLEAPEPEPAPSTQGTEGTP